MKINNQVMPLRGSNKKYTALDDLDELYEQLKTKSIGELSKELGIPYNSIRFRVTQYFPKDWQDTIKYQRKRHTNRKN